MLKIILVIFFISCNTYALNNMYINVAVSSNFLSTFHVIAKEFESKYSCKINICSDSTANLYNKIINKAPFDIFISADAKHPLLLEAITFTKSFIYAYGKIVLFGKKFKKNFFRNHRYFSNVALANRFLSPYGEASYKIIENLRLNFKTAVIGMNINQTYNFVYSNSSCIGFVSISQVLNVNIDKDFLWFCPVYLYPSIEQRAILLNNTYPNDILYSFMSYFKSEYVKSIIKQHGYAVI